MPLTLTTAEQLQLREAAVRLQRQFEGKLNAETIERFMNDSLDQLVARANTGMWIPLLAERFARDRLRALVRLESDLTTLNPSVLFLCVHNAGRSQMAAGWMRHLAGESIDVFSGGSEPAENVNQAAVAAMATGPRERWWRCLMRGGASEGVESAPMRRAPQFAMRSSALTAGR